jgi:hypothetical protein
LLLILHEVGEVAGDADPEHATKVIHSQIAFLARDFWVRYPDYLADELIDMAIDSSDVIHLEQAERLLDDPTIDFDWLPMVRWKNGAYWWMTDAIAILVSNELVEYVPKSSTNGIAQHRYYLTQVGEDFVDSKLAGVSEFDAIRTRAQLAALIDPGAPGTQLKLKQYDVEEYAGTAQGSTIPPRLDAVRLRAKEVRAAWA